MTVNLSDIKQKRPDQLTVGELAFLIEEIEECRSERRKIREEARWTGVAWIVDGCGIEKLVRRGVVPLDPGSGDRWPRSFFLPVRSTVAFGLTMGTDVPVAAVMSKREFRLREFRGYDGIPVYEEVV